MYVQLGHTHIPLAAKKMQMFKWRVMFTLKQLTRCGLSMHLFVTHKIKHVEASEATPGCSLRLCHT